MVKILEHNKSTIYHEPYLNIFSNGVLYYLNVLTDRVFNTSNNYETFQELKLFLLETLVINTQEVSIINVLIL